MPIGRSAMGCRERRERQRDVAGLALLCQGACCNYGAAASLRIPATALPAAAEAIRKMSMPENTSRPLEGQVALVTGGSSGIGAGVAVALTSAGAAVGVNYASSAEGAAVAL